MSVTGHTLFTIPHRNLRMICW